MYTVYMHINRLNNKKYVGMTSRDPKIRWGSNGCNYKKSIAICRAIKKYNWINFDHVILKSNLTKKQAESLEVYYIDKYNSANRKYGYNISLGGNSQGKMSQETKDKIGLFNKGKKGAVWSQQAKKHMSETKTGKQMGKDNPMSRKIRCISTGIVYGSVIQAAQKVNISHSGISECCNGRQKTSGGYTWEYCEKRTKKIYVVKPKYSTKKILCVELRIVYPSMREASIKTDTPYNGISVCCKGRQKTSGGYTWKYVV